MQTQNFEIKLNRLLNHGHYLDDSANGSVYIFVTRGFKSSYSKISRYLRHFQIQWSGL